MRIQVEKEAGINYANQYWFALKRYPIANEYVFGPSEPIGFDQTQRQIQVNPIQSGDTLIMYITQTSPSYQDKTVFRS